MKYSKVIFFLILIILIFIIFRSHTAKTPSVGQAETVSSKPKVKKFPVLINNPKGPPTIKTNQTDYHGESIEVSCVTCHTTRTPNLNNKKSEDLDEFHQNLKFNHGSLSCLSCHNANNYNTLKKADGEVITYSNVMELCAQCHGPQYRDYLKGSHGGMTGFWDLTKGSRQRNNCIDCHDAHTPQYPRVSPVFLPKDRDLQQKEPSNHE